MVQARRYDPPVRYERLDVSRDGHVGWLIFDRPDALNALDPQMFAELEQAWLSAARDPHARAIVLRAIGKHFCAGADTKGERRQRPADASPGFTPWEELDFIRNIAKPTIAAINGHAFGGGCELALACDLRVAADHAKFGQPEVGLGIIPGAGATQRLPRIIGQGRAAQLVLTGDPIDAATALSWGLVNVVVPADELPAAARALAGRILSKGPVAVRLAKLALRASARVDLDSGLVIETLAQAICFETDDKREGTSAFLEKRKPRFSGA